LKEFNVFDHLNILSACFLIFKSPNSKLQKKTPNSKKGIMEQKFKKKIKPQITSIWQGIIV